LGETIMLAARIELILLLMRLATTVKLSPEQLTKADRKIIHDRLAAGKD
jgi:hypothetical protein